MIEERRVYMPGFHEKTPGYHWRQRKTQPAVHLTTGSTQREAMDLQKLAAIAAIEAQRAERRGKPVIAPGDGTTIANPALRLLVRQAKEDLAGLSSCQRAAKRAGGQEKA